MRAKTCPICRLGTRASALALWQTQKVADAIKKIYPLCRIDIVRIATLGDKFSGALTEAGGKGLFVKEIEDALLKDAIDIAVHSLKDMPYQIPKGLIIAGVLKREDARDALVARKGKKFKTLPPFARVGTGSLRRAVQLARIRSDITVVPIRGNVPTRIKKLKTEKLDAIVLAAAGLKRLGFKSHISEYFSVEKMIPSAGQGIIAMECRANDAKTKNLIRKITHSETLIRALAERAFLETIKGDCKTPMGAYAKLERGKIKISGFISEPDGGRFVDGEAVGDVKTPKEAGKKLARRLL